MIELQIMVWDKNMIELQIMVWDKNMIELQIMVWDRNINVAELNMIMRSSSSHNSNNRNK
jgi:hypothetical protein